jgi:hypothetical protein
MGKYADKRKEKENAFFSEESMNWFERNKNLFNADPFEELHAWLHEAEIHTALNEMAGPTGISRFLLYFRIERGKSIIEHIDSVPLVKGGGPPKNTSDGTLARLKKSISSLSSIMSRFSFQKGCLGFVRDYRNEYELLCFFDEDLEALSLEVLPVPQYSYPLEEPVYLKHLGSNEYQLSQVISQSSRIVPDWEEWSIEKDTLLLNFTDKPTKRHNIMVLGTFLWSQFLWNWQVDEPLFSEDAYSCMEFLATWDQVMELGYLTTVRLNGNWLFVGQVDDATVLLCSVYDGI